MQRGLKFSDTTAPAGMQYVCNGRSHRGGMFQDYKTYWHFVEYYTTSTARERIRTCYRSEQYIEQNMKPLNT